MIDDFAEVKALTEKIEEHLPIVVRLTPNTLKTLQTKEGKKVRDREYEIEKVFYSGDEGGILCALKDDPEDESVCVISITHLIVTEDCPLAEEIQAYQKKRTIRLAIANGKMGRARRLAKKQRKKKGFGS